jgi:hypothetical protein
MEEVKALKLIGDMGVVKIITAKEMNEKQRKTTQKRKGSKG